MNNIFICESDWYARLESFARETVKDTVDRRGVGKEQQIRDIRVGKLGEYGLFLWFIENNLPAYGFQYFLVRNHGDLTTGDFTTRDNKKIDVKTASLDYHRKILIPYDQFDKMPKDLYVGVRVNDKIAEKRAELEVIGYATHAQIKLNGINSSQQFPAYWEWLNKLRPMDEFAKQYYANR